MSNYLPIAICVLWGLFELFGLAKDWTSHKKVWRRVVVILLIIGIAVLTGINVHEGQTQNAGLREAVSAANQNLKDSLTRFGDDIRKLSRDVSDLRTQRGSTEFQKKADQLTAALESEAKLVAQLKAKFEAKAGFKTDATLVPNEVQSKPQPDLENRIREISRLQSRIKDLETQIKQVQRDMEKEISEASHETDIRKSFDKMIEKWRVTPEATVPKSD